MLTREEAERAVRDELRKQKLTQRMTPAEMTGFCQKMYSSLEFPSKADRMQDIRAWAERWQSQFLREMPDGTFKNIS